MKKIILSLALTASVAHAQTPATTTAAPAPAAAPVQTSTIEADASLASKFAGSLAIESSVGMKATQTGKAEDGYLGSKAPVLTAWTMGLKYKYTKTAYVEVQQIAYTRSNLENVSPGEAPLFPDAADGKKQALNDVVLKAGQSTDLRIFGSEPLSFSARFYLPTSKTTRQVTKRDGTLRADVVPAWNLSSKVTFEYALSPRIILQSAESRDGRDAIYRMVMGPSLTYNFNDNLNIYGAATADIRSKELGRGTWGAEKLNLITPEIGANIVVGKVTINPALSSDVDMNDGSASLIGNESRIFSNETTSYNLNIYATF